MFRLVGPCQMSNFTEFNFQLTSMCQFRYLLLGIMNMFNSLHAGGHFSGPIIESYPTGSS